MKKGRNEVEKNESRNIENDAQRKRHSVFQRNKKQIQRKMAIHRKGFNEPYRGTRPLVSRPIWKCPYDFATYDCPLNSDKEQEIGIRENKVSKVIIKEFGA